MPFQYICEIIPELDYNGQPKEYLPQSRYKNKSNRHLHRYGRGPFCRFKIPEKYNGKTGVYAILINGIPKYIGECENLAMRFNMGYGNISPRNCYDGGQSTNCRINMFILEAYKKNLKIDLMFYKTRDRFNIENKLIKEFSPELNSASGKSLANNSRKELSQKIKISYNAKIKTCKNKYYKLEEFFKCNQNQTEILNFNEIEKILGFKLPVSAYTYRAWWGNDKIHRHAHAWLNSGWHVSSVSLGKSVTFVKLKLFNK
jgi:hypothetical protein